MPDYKNIALTIISRHTTKVLGVSTGWVNTEPLGEDLAGQTISYLLAVCQVFNNLGSTDRAWTGYYMVRKLPDAVLLRIARYKEGNTLLASISKWLGDNKLTQGGSWVAEFNIVQERISTVRRQAGTVTKYNPHGVRELLDYEIPAGGKKEIRFELPEEGANYVVYNRNDEIVDGLDQVGTKETIEAIFKIAEVWKSKGTGAYFEVGDISRAGGLDTSAHKSHEDGKAFDMRPMRNDGGISNRGFTYKEIPPYHRGWTCEIIRIILRLYSGSIIYFNDEEIYKDPAFRGKVVKMGKDGTPEGHDNHLHVILPGGERLLDQEGK